MLYREDIETLDRIQALAIKDIKCVVDRGTIAPADYQNLEKAVNIVHYINEIYKDDATTEAMEQYGKTEYEVSSDAMRSYGPNVMLPMDKYGRDPYYNHSSYERGRSARTGRYISRDGENEHIRTKIQEMMPTVTDPNERMALQHIVDKL